MTELGPITQVDASLLTEGVNQLEEGYVATQKRGAEAFLANGYMNGLLLYEAHLVDINQRIADAGGIKRVYTAEHDGINYIKCKDKSQILASEILIAPPVSLALPVDIPTSGILPEQPTHESYVQLSAGGFPGLGLGAVEKPYDIYNRNTFFKETIPDLLEGKPAPTTIAVKEVVVTKSGIDSTVATSGLVYAVTGRVWGAKLREEFAPDPYENPEEYQAWAAQEPIPRLDIGFQATPAPHRADYHSIDGAKFDRFTPMKPYYDDNAMLSLSIEGAGKMLRFGTLLNTLWQDKFGVDMPMRGQTALSGTELRMPELNP